MEPRIKQYEGPEAFFASGPFFDSGWNPLLFHVGNHDHSVFFFPLLNQPDDAFRYYRIDGYRSICSNDTHFGVYFFWKAK